MFKTGEYVLVKEHGGRYVAKILSVGEFEDQDGVPLLGVQVLVMDEEPSYSLEEGETCNIYKAEAEKLDEL